LACNLVAERLPRRGVRDFVVANATSRDQQKCARPQASNASNICASNA
jgi:hypothetical protein